MRKSDGGGRVEVREQYTKKPKVPKVTFSLVVVKERRRYWIEGTSWAEPPTLAGSMTDAVGRPERRETLEEGGPVPTDFDHEGVPRSWVEHVSVRCKMTIRDVTPGDHGRSPKRLRRKRTRRQ